MVMKGAKAAVFAIVLAAFCPNLSLAGDYRLFQWVELIGFDNAVADFGVAAYLGRMDRKPDVVSLLLDDDQLMLTHKPGNSADFVFSPQNCSYGARPFNPERRRQNWTSHQLKGLVAELKRQGVTVFASFFARHERYPVEPARADEVGDRLTSFLVDYGFDGLHGSDGYAPPRYLLPESAGKERVRLAREYARKYADNWKTFVSKMKPKGLKCWINTCWTRDPYEALYRYGVDYRLLAKTGVDGFVVESSAATQSIKENWNFMPSAPIDRSMAMLLRLKACVPDMPMVMLHAINDANEEWSVLRHAPTRGASEAYALGGVFYGRRRALDGVLACLTDDITGDEWSKLDRIWSLAFAPAEGPVGLRVVWSDRAFDAEFEDLVVSQDASSNTILSELIRRGAPINASVSVAEAMADKTMPILLVNPAFFPEDELAALRDRLVTVAEIGRGARVPMYRTAADLKYVPIPEGTPPFPGMPRETTCYWKKPIPENMPPEAAYAEPVNRAFGATPYRTPTKGLRSFCYRMKDGRLAVFARNENETYLPCSFDFHVTGSSISDVKVHTDYPSLPIATTLRSKVAPHDTIFFSVGEHEIPLTGREAK